MATESLASEGQVSLTILLTGLVVVFSALVVLIFVIILYSKITKMLTQKKTSSSETKVVEKPPVQQKEVIEQPIVEEAEDGISGETLAAISAAVYYTYSSKAKICSVKRSTARNSGVRSAWSRAGIAQNTKPF